MPPCQFKSEIVFLPPIGGQIEFIKYQLQSVRFYDAEVVAKYIH